MAKHVFISGAQSVGKTTLLHKLNEVLNYKVVEEAARRLIVEGKYTQKDLNPQLNPTKVQELNLKLLKSNSKSLVDSRNSNTLFDRGLDPLVYAKFYLGDVCYQELLRTDAARSLIFACQHQKVFVIYPHVECMANDEIRLPIPLSELIEFTEMMADVYSSLKVRWYPVEMLDLNERVEYILRILKRKDRMELRN